MPDGVSRPLASGRAAGILRVIDEMVKDGVFQQKNMRNMGLSTERVVASLREKGLPHLSAMEQLFMEDGGCFTIIQQKDSRSGLSLLLIWEVSRWLESHVCPFPSGL